MFLVAPPNAIAGKIEFLPYPHSGPFVQYPALAVGSLVGFPVAVLVGAVSAPVLAFTCDDSCRGIWDETLERALVLGFVAGLPPAFITGLPFLGLKALFWSLPRSLAESLPGDGENTDDKDAPRPRPPEPRLIPGDGVSEGV
jgi:hypothetical protein